MNRPPESYVLVQEERLLAFCIACFEKAGIDHDHAAVISRFLVNSDLRGVRSHGTRTISGYCNAFEQGSCNPHPDIRQIHETPTAVVIDGDGTLGYLPMARATEAAIAKAKEVGIGMGLARHIGHYGSAGHYTRMCMEEGCIGFSVQGYRQGKTPPSVEPKPQIGYFGNPPLSFGIPSGDEPPVVLDVATRILADYQTSPEFDDLLTRIPAAFFKSIGYGAVSILLGGALTGYTQPSADEMEARWKSSRNGGMILAIHIGSVVPEEVFTTEVDRFVRNIRENFEPMPWYDEALLPGAIEEETMARHLRDGIRLGEMEQDGIRGASERLGIPLPWDE